MMIFEKGQRFEFQGRKLTIESVRTDRVTYRWDDGHRVNWISKRRLRDEGAKLLTPKKDTTETPKERTSDDVRMNPRAGDVLQVKTRYGWHTRFVLEWLPTWQGGKVFYYREVDGKAQRNIITVTLREWRKQVANAGVLIVSDRGEDCVLTPPWGKYRVSERLTRRGTTA